MANEKVSQMLSLTAAEVAGEDLFLISDMSARESKKISASDIMTYIETSGSFNAVTSINSDTASYLLESGRNITVTSASYSKTASIANFTENSTYSDTSSLAITASYVDLSGVSEVATASYLKYIPGQSTGTSSYSLTASFVDMSRTSSFLLYTPGISNGTASYSLTSSFSLKSITSSYSPSSSVSISSSYAITSSFANTASYIQNSSILNPIGAWAYVTFSALGHVYPEVYMDQNISSFKFLNKFTNIAGAGLNWYHYGVAFTNPLSSNKYALNGVASAPLDFGSYYSFIAFHPTASNRTITSCTMSVGIGSVAVPGGDTWFIKTSTKSPYLSFSVLQE